MNRPDFTINSLLRSEGGALPTSQIQQVRSKLLNRGFVMVLSDTCYSLGVLAIDEESRRKVNEVLGRKDEPISLAFGGFFHVQQYVEVDNSIARLLEQFTPGPITLVCKAKAHISKEFLSNTIGSPDGTIGVRIPDSYPDSYIERDIATCTSYPLMTIAVRDNQSGEPVQDFEKALNIVSAGIHRVGRIGWGAIEGGAFYGRHSTVVRVGVTEGVRLLREGDISLEEILTTVKGISGFAMEDWGK